MYRFSGFLIAALMLLTSPLSADTAQQEEPLSVEFRRLTDQTLTQDQLNQLMQVFLGLTPTTDPEEIPNLVAHHATTLGFDEEIVRKFSENWWFDKRSHTSDYEEPSFQHEGAGGAENAGTGFAIEITLDCYNSNLLATLFVAIDRGHLESVIREFEPSQTPDRGNGTLPFLAFDTQAGDRIEAIDHKGRVDAPDRVTHFSDEGSRINLARSGIITIFLSEETPEYIALTWLHAETGCEL
ncbi:MAG: hypothetical protein ACPGUX_11610 [Halocynthiibacter sp.]